MRTIEVRPGLSIRGDGNLYCLSDLYKRTPYNKFRHPKNWMRRQGHIITTRGVLFKTYWGGEGAFREYARYMNPYGMKELDAAIGYLPPSLLTEEDFLDVPRRAVVAAPYRPEHRKVTRPAKRDDGMAYSYFTDDYQASPSHHSHSCSSNWGGDGGGDGGGGGGCD